MISKQDVYNAYKKFKSYIYYDNTLVHVRVELAKFEADNALDEKFKEIKKIVNSSNDGDFSMVETYLDEIGFFALPKKIKDDKHEIEDNIFINKKIQKQYEIEKFNLFIECPIELHLISVLWIMKIGYKLDEKLSENIYGYRLEKNKDGFFEDSSYKLFEKYHEKYRGFRDGAIEKAIKLHELNLDVTLINLDIKEFFYNIHFDFVKDCRPRDSNALNIIMNMIHHQYQTVIYESKLYNKKEVKKIIPIGLLSSSIVANYSLHKFDSYVTSKIQPEFYSRYVDDVLLVFSNKKIDYSKPINKLLEKLFKCEDKDKILIFKKKSIDIKLKKNTFTVQDSKTKLFFFSSIDSIYLLKKFRDTITHNSSIFNLLPEDKDIFKSIEESSYGIAYSSTVNKISSINDSSIDILKISQNLSEMINIILLTKHSEEEIRQYNLEILKVFSGKNIFHLIRLWEKLFAYFILTKSKTEIIEFSLAVLNAINRTSFTDKNTKNIIKSGLLQYFSNALLMSVSLDLNFYEKRILPILEHSETTDIVKRILTYVAKEYIRKDAKYILDANLLRHYYIQVPLLNYCENIDSKTLSKSKLSLKHFNFKLDPKKIKYSPRFVHYHELSIFYFTKFLYQKNVNSESDYLTNKTKFILDRYQNFNKSPLNKRYYPKTKNNDLSEEIIIPSNNTKHKFKIGIVNIQVYAENSIQSFLGKPDLSFKRLLEIYEVLNLSVKTKCDLVIFPEISVPLKWLDMIINFARRNEVGFVFGLEHFSINKVVHNYSVVALPFKDGKYNNIMVDFNLKENYSPEEIKEIKGRRYNLNSNNSSKTKIYRWKGAFFSTFNCYELTDIKKRAELVGQNDFTVAIEYNRDTNYFSNIVGSISRDIHAYIVQVNNSQHGDSRITKPAKQESMDIIKIKGGNNVSLITGEIDIKALRQFQMKNHTLQETDKRFKFTPPGFKTKMHKKRKKF